MKRGAKKMPVRKLAEWVTLGVSTATILGLTTYLVLDLTETDTPYIELVATPLHAQARRVGERFVVPIEIENRGNRTVTYASFSVAVAGSEARAETVEVEYLARESTQRVYKFVERDPASAKVTVTPVYYRLD